MKKSVILIVVAVTMIFAACQKSEMMDNSLNVDLNKYETQLTQDYIQASQFHTNLTTNNVSASDHTAHHGGASTSTTTIDIPYNKMMFAKNDSLFSDHFYKFCKDMMQNSGMMSGSTGMMGNNSNMMGSGNMMNGGTMGGSMDMNKMMAYMDSVYQSGKTMMNPDFMRNDSLLHNQMNMCKMMTTQTDGVETVYNNMQTLRKNHRLVH